MDNQDYIKEQCRQEFPSIILRYTQKSKHGNFICTECGSGTGKHKSGAMTYYKDSHIVKCHKCGYYADVFKFWADVHGLDVKRDFSRVFDGVCGDLGLSNKGLAINITRKSLSVAKGFYITKSGISCRHSDVFP